MFESGGTLKHLAFFEELAGLEESDSSWRAVTAGLVVLRLVDAWIEEGPKVVTADAWGVRAVRSAIDEMSAGDPGRSILRSVVGALENVRGSDFHQVAPRLAAYGRSLEYAAKWTLAADVYHTILSHTHPLDDCDVAISAHLRLGECYRNLNDGSAALAAFGDAGQVANAVGDIVGFLRSRIGEAHIAVLRGNLPRADEILAQTVDVAQREALQDVHSRALHDRAMVAHLRHDYERSVRLAYSALELSTAQTERDRILSDIAASFVDLGVYSAARDAYLILASTAQEQYIRWAATINLMNIAALETRELLFDQYRRALADVALPPIAEVNYHLIVGQGYHRLHQLDAARAHLEIAVEAAAKYQFHQLVYEAEEALRSLPREAKTPKPEQPAFELEDVATAIRRMREAAPTGV